MLFSIILNLLMLTDPTLNPKINVPKTWTPEFTVSVDFSGSMDGSAFNLKLTYDSCIYKRISYRDAEGNFTVSFKLTEADRKEILNKLKELKVEKMKRNENSAPMVVNDGYSKTLCIGNSCISGGAGNNLDDKTRDIFSSACGFLEEFAARKK